ncbi:hypothetical protein N0V94_005258 [Neodidymelliopsis sp. IMI 364377]|nr:hypothetical protein N0V94_005258 [Neodidymelliopsis sp. IMI 364377]
MKTYGVGEGHYIVADIVLESTKFDQQRSKDVMTPENSRIIRGWLKYHYRYDVTHKTVRHVLFPMRAEEDFLAQQETSMTLPKVDAPKIDYKQARKEASLMARRAYKPANMHTLMTVKETQPKQNEDVNVRVSILNPQHFKKKVRLSIRADYIEESSLTAGQQLYMLSIPHNNAHWTTNLFSNISDRPPLLACLEAAMRNKTGRLSAETADATLQDIVNDADFQVFYDPLV